MKRKLPSSKVLFVLLCTRSINHKDLKVSVDATSKLELNTPNESQGVCLALLFARSVFGSIWSIGEMIGLYTSDDEIAINRI